MTARAKYWIAALYLRGGYAWNVEDDDTKNVRLENDKWTISQRGKSDLSAGGGTVIGPLEFLNYGKLCCHRL